MYLTLSMYLLFFHSAYKHYHLAIHIFGLMTQATMLHKIDDTIHSTTVVFSSSCSGQKVEKHFHNLHRLLTRVGPPEIDERRIEEENIVVGNHFYKWRIAFCSVTQNLWWGSNNIYDGELLLFLTKAGVTIFGLVSSSVMINICLKTGNNQITARSFHSQF